MGPKSSLNFINIPISNTIKNKFHNPNSHTINYTPYYRVRTPPIPRIRSISKRLRLNFWRIWHLKEFPLFLLLFSQTLFSSSFSFLPDTILSPIFSSFIFNIILLSYLIIKTQMGLKKHTPLITTHHHQISPMLHLSLIIK